MRGICPSASLREVRSLRLRLASIARASSWLFSGNRSIIHLSIELKQSLTSNDALLFPSLLFAFPDLYHSFSLCLTVFSDSEFNLAINAETLLKLDDCVITMPKLQVAKPLICGKLKHANLLLTIFCQSLRCWFDFISRSIISTSDSTLITFRESLLTFWLKTYPCEADRPGGLEAFGFARLKSYRSRSVPTTVNGFLIYWNEVSLIGDYVN